MKRLQNSLPFFNCFFANLSIEDILTVILIIRKEVSPRNFPQEQPGTAKNRKDGSDWNQVMERHMFREWLNWMSAKSPASRWLEGFKYWFKAVQLYPIATLWLGSSHFRGVVPIFGSWKRTSVPRGLLDLDIVFIMLELVWKYLHQYQFARMNKV